MINWKGVMVQTRRIAIRGGHSLVVVLGLGHRSATSQMESHEHGITSIPPNFDL